MIYGSAAWGPRLGPQFGTDFMSTYFNDWLARTGITDITDITQISPRQMNWRRFSRVA